MAAASCALVQLTAFDTALGGSQAKRTAIARAKLALDRPELQFSDTQRPDTATAGPQLFGTKPFAFCAVAELQPTGPQLLCAKPEFFRAVRAKSALVVVGFVPFLRRWRQGSAMRVD